MKNEKFFQKIETSFLKKKEFFMNKWEKIEKKQQNLILLILLISLLLVTLTIGGKLYLHYQINHAFSSKNNPQIFVINSGETARKIAQNLEKKGLIKNDLYFLIYLKTFKSADNKISTIKAGKYLLSPSLNISQITEKLINGLIISSEIKITIPEGYNIFQVADLLKEKKLIIESKDFINASINLEGYLFPDTYQIKEDASIKSIVKKMLDNFQNKVGNLLPASRNLVDIITIASLLEKEVISDYDRQVVAGIIEKRIKIGMPLQIDATILYAQALNGYEDGYKTNIKNNHNPVSAQDTEIDSPYNTYKYKELPPGPICNPGINTIKAALDPIKTDYWYYLNTKEGRTIFSKTYEEHLTNKQKYLR